MPVLDSVYLIEAAVMEGPTSASTVDPENLRPQSCADVGVLMSASDANTNGMRTIASCRFGTGLGYR